MPPLTWPSDLHPGSVEMSLRTNTQRYISELNGVEQASQLPGARWMATLGFDRRMGEKARILRAFFSSLLGPAGRFYLPVFDQPTPAGSAQGPGIVSGAGQTGSTLTTSGWTPDQAGLLLAGDYFQVGDELKILTADASSDAAGVAVLTFVPPLRTSPADAAQIVTTYPACVMALADDEQTRWAVTAPYKYGFGISCREPLDL